jgi:hypothetical protein
MVARCACSSAMARLPSFSLHSPSPSARPPSSSATCYHRYGASPPPPPRTIRRPRPTRASSASFLTRSPWIRLITSHGLRHCQQCACGTHRCWGHVLWLALPAPILLPSFMVVEPDEKLLPLRTQAATRNAATEAEREWRSRHTSWWQRQGSTNGRCSSGKLGDGACGVVDECGGEAKQAKRCYVGSPSNDR